MRTTLIASTVTLALAMSACGDDSPDTTPTTTDAVGAPDTTMDQTTDTTMAPATTMSPDTTSPDSSPSETTMPMDGMDPTTEDGVRISAADLTSLLQEHGIWPASRSRPPSMPAATWRLRPSRRLSRHSTRTRSPWPR
ncbi:MAG: hypothetical protein R2713_08155 [Ilumatobacteraceae bacterium]